MRRIKIVLVLMALALVAFPSRTLLAQAPEKIVEAGEKPLEPRKYIDLDFTDTDLREVVDDIEKKTGINIHVQKGIEEKVTVHLIGVYWKNALDIVVKEADCKVEQKAPGLWIVSQPPKVNMEFRDAPIRVVLDLLARQAGKNIVIHQEIKGNISLNLSNVEWMKALDTVVKTAGYVMVVEEENLIRVVRRQDLEQQLETRIFQLNYIRPPDAFKATISSRGGPGGDRKGEGMFFIGEPKAAKGVPEEDFTLFRALRNVIKAGEITGESLEYNVESNSFIVTATRPKLAE